MTWNFAYLASFSKDYFCLFGTGMDLPNRQTIGMAPNRIKELREALGMTLETLAEKVGLSSSYVQRLEKGDRNLSVRHLGAFAAALGVQPRDLIDEDDGDAKLIDALRSASRAKKEAVAVLLGLDPSSTAKDPEPVALSRHPRAAKPR